MNDQFVKKIIKDYSLRTGLVWLCCSVVFFFTYILVLKPQGQLKRKLESQLIEHKGNYEAASRTSDKAAQEQLSKEIDQLNSKLRRFVTDSNGSANLTFDVSKVASENKVSSFSVKSKDSKDLFEIKGCTLIGENRMDVSFKGTFIQFARFLNALEQHEPVVFVDSFVIERGRESANENNVAMMLSVYVEKRQDS